MAEPGLRERKKLRTRRTISAVAVRLFDERGFDATTVDDICTAAEVSASTFFRYFGTKEAAAFPDEEARTAVVLETLRERPADEALHHTIRRAALAMVDHGLARADDLRASADLRRREPALAAHAARMQAEAAERLAEVIAGHLGTDPATDVRTRLAVHAAFAAVNAAWTAWLERDDADLRSLAEEAFDLLDGGLAAALAD
jgi:AcrR family transcriptional regulator